MAQEFKKRIGGVTGMLLVTQLLHVGIAHAIPKLDGTWSDPPPRAEDAFCHVGCPIEAREYLTQILDAPDNLEKSFAQLRSEAQRFQRVDLLPSHLTPEALKNYPFDRAADPSLTACTPWGFTRQILAPHAMQVTQAEDQISLYYSEWTARRTIYLDGRAPPTNLQLSRLGFSVGHYEGETLVVETTGISADHSNAGFGHSAQLTSIERYNLTEDGNRLEVNVTFSDPPTLQKPLVMARAWTWAPTEEIYPYEDCIIPGQ